MSIFSKARTAMSGQTKEEFGFGERHPLDPKIRKSINFYMNSLTNKDLEGWTFERRRSEYPGAKSDLVVYNAEGKVVLNGREFEGGSNKTAFWE